MAQTYQVLFGDAASPADAAFYRLLSSVEVEENADLPGAIQLNMPITTTGAAGHGDLTIVSDERFAPYARVAVVVSADGRTDACIFDGCVLSHRIHLRRGTTASSAQVWGQDLSCLMNLEDRVHEWKDADDCTIANAIFKDNYSFTPSPANTPGPSDGKHTVMQRGTDAQFLRERARRSGKLFRVFSDARAGDTTGYFATPTLTGTAAATLVLNPAMDANVDALDFSWDVARPTEVLAQALALEKDAADGGTTDSGLQALDSRPLARFAGKAMKTRLTAAVDGGGELRSRAESLLREASWFVTCEGEGDLARIRVVLRVGTLVQVNGAGLMHSGRYLVWSVRHTITVKSHRMKFVLVRNAVGG